MWDLPKPETEPGSLALAGGFFTTEPPGKPPPLFFRFFSHIGHYRVLSRVPTAIQYGPVILNIRADMKNINYLLNTAL